MHHHFTSHAMKFRSAPEGERIHQAPTLFPPPASVPNDAGRHATELQFGEGSPSRYSCDATRVSPIADYADPPIPCLKLRGTEDVPRPDLESPSPRGRRGPFEGVPIPVGLHLDPLAIRTADQELIVVVATAALRTSSEGHGADG